jgi:hypothetical protein
MVAGACKLAQGKRLHSEAPRLESRSLIRVQLGH